MIYVVSGANYGDEGKGLVTNALCNKDSLVVLSNGSSQRAHTVVHDGKRVVFRHFGSGTLKGAGTYFARDFLVNPAMFRQEYTTLRAMGIVPRVYMHEDCKLITPVDMYANVNIESRRGDKSHGSTGCGVWESIRRGVFAGELTVECSDLHASLDYYRSRLVGMSDKLPDEVGDFLSGKALIYNWDADVEFLCKHVQLINRDEERFLLHDFIDVVFENGQGLLLDTDYVGDSIYTTPCHVGAKIPARIIYDNFCGENPEIESIYVTRTYLTRHGKGNIGRDNVCEVQGNEIKEGIEDKTNVPNPNQGHLRYGIFTPREVTELARRVKKDSDFFTSCGLMVKPALAVTHTNEHGADTLIEEFISEATCLNMLPEVYTSDNEKTLLMNTR